MFLAYLGIALCTFFCGLFLMVVFKKHIRYESDTEELMFYLAVASLMWPVGIPFAILILLAAFFPPWFHDTFLKEKEDEDHDK